MKRILMAALTATGLSIGMVGCAEKSKVQETKRVETPGGTTEQTTTQETRKTGEHKDTEPSSTTTTPPETKP